MSTTTDKPTVEEIRAKVSDGYEITSGANPARAALIMLGDLKKLLAEIDRLKAALEDERER